ncbi:hypothetical protein PVAP13_1NG450538 [Panicum virgatum]|uniref:Uncharacterized protein n=1 Tax=Panicum virgatum TaxID=38727 RepID=A0A8T0X7J8_PANVG|nr:hypothetical protein PVAP13_1NG450538 [Panicum virgatum]
MHVRFFSRIVCDSCDRETKHPKWSRCCQHGPALLTWPDRTPTAAAAAWRQQRRVWSGLVCRSGAPVRGPVLRGPALRGARGLLMPGSLRPSGRRGATSVGATAFQIPPARPLPPARAAQNRLQRIASRRTAPPTSSSSPPAPPPPCAGRPTVPRLSRRRVPRHSRRDVPPAAGWSPAAASTSSAACALLRPGLPARRAPAVGYCGLGVGPRLHAHRCRLLRARLHAGPPHPLAWPVPATAASASAPASTRAAAASCGLGSTRGCRIHRRGPSPTPEPVSSRSDPVSNIRDRNGSLGSPTHSPSPLP